MDEDEVQTMLGIKKPPKDHSATPERPATRIFHGNS